MISFCKCRRIAHNLYNVPVNLSICLTGALCHLGEISNIKSLAKDLGTRNALTNIRYPFIIATEAIQLKYLHLRSDAG